MSEVAAATSAYQSLKRDEKERVPSTAKPSLLKAAIDTLREANLPFALQLERVAQKTGFADIQRERFTMQPSVDRAVSEFMKTEGISRKDLHESMQAITAKVEDIGLGEKLVKGLNSTKAKKIGIGAIKDSFPALVAAFKEDTPAIRVIKHTLTLLSKKTAALSQRETAFFESRAHKKLVKTAAGTTRATPEQVKASQDALLLTTVQSLVSEPITSLLSLKDAGVYKTARSTTNLLIAQEKVAQLKGLSKKERAEILQTIITLIYQEDFDQIRQIVSIPTNNNEGVKRLVQVVEQTKEDHIVFMRAAARVHRDAKPVSGGPPADAIPPGRPERREESDTRDSLVKELTDGKVSSTKELLHKGEKLLPTHIAVQLREGERVPIGYQTIEVPVEETYEYTLGRENEEEPIHRIAKSPKLFMEQLRADFEAGLIPHSEDEIFEQVAQRFFKSRVTVTHPSTMRVAVRRDAFIAPTSSEMLSSILRDLFTLNLPHLVTGPITKLFDRSPSRAAQAIREVDSILNVPWIRDAAESTAIEANTTAEDFVGGALFNFGYYWGLVKLLGSMGAEFADTHSAVAMGATATVISVFRHAFQGAPADAGIKSLLGQPWGLMENVKSFSGIVQLRTRDGEGGNNIQYITSYGELRPLAYPSSFFRYRYDTGRKLKMLSAADVRSMNPLARALRLPRNIFAAIPYLFGPILTKFFNRAVWVTQCGVGGPTIQVDIKRQFDVPSNDMPVYKNWMRLITSGLTEHMGIKEAVTIIVGSYILQFVMGITPLAGTAPGTSAWKLYRTIHEFLSLSPAYVYLPTWTLVNIVLSVARVASGGPFNRKLIAEAQAAAQEAALTGVGDETYIISQGGLPGTEIHEALQEPLQKVIEEAGYSIQGEINIKANPLRFWFQDASGQCHVIAQNQATALATTPGEDVPNCIFTSTQLFNTFKAVIGIP